MKIYSIFNSIDGEVNLYGQGTFTTFIRFAGCNLRCKWCDTKYAQELDSGMEMKIHEVIEQLVIIGCKKVTITGGEPLLQPDHFKILTKELWHRGYITTVETNGSFPLEGYGVSSWVVDYKLPSSGMTNKMNLDVFTQLRANDYIKFVITDKLDYETAKSFIFEEAGGRRAKNVFSPAHGILDPKELISWMKEDELFGVQVNIQIHKLVDTGEAK